MTTTDLNTEVRPTFWTGKRQAEVIRVNDDGGNLPEVEDFRKFTRVYYRRFNDGDKPHPQTFARFARLTGFFDTEEYQAQFFPHENDTLLERMGDVLLDRALKAIEERDHPTTRDAFDARPLEATAIYAAAILEEGNKGDTITLAELRDLVDRHIASAHYPAMLRLVEAVAAATE